MTNFIVETSLPTPMTARVYVNLLEGIICRYKRVFFGMQSRYNANMTENGIYPRCNGIDEG